MVIIKKVDCTYEIGLIIPQVLCMSTALQIVLDALKRNLPVEYASWRDRICNYRKNYGKTLIRIFERKPMLN